MSYFSELQNRVEIGEGVFIAPNATVIGDVQLKDHCSIWYNAVIRGDKDRIVIGEGSNIQDGTIIHTDPGIQMIVGKRVTVGHRVILHGCKVGDYSLVGMGSIMLNNSSVGKGCVIGAGSLITEGKHFPDHSLIMGSPAKLVREIPAAISDQFQKGVESYLQEAMKYLQNP